MVLAWLAAANNKSADLYHASSDTEWADVVSDHVTAWEAETLNFHLVGPERIRHMAL